MNTYNDFLSQIIDLGYTEVPAQLRVDFLLDLSDRYTPAAYSLFHNNCNNFSCALSSKRARLKNPDDVCPTLWMPAVGYSKRLL